VRVSRRRKRRNTRATAAQRQQQAAVEQQRRRRQGEVEPAPTREQVVHQATLARQFLGETEPPLVRARVLTLTGAEVGRFAMAGPSCADADALLAACGWVGLTVRAIRAECERRGWRAVVNLPKSAAAE
jgi:hypothetical protein